jgi:hypothetical protein
MSSKILEAKSSFFGIFYFFTVEKVKVPFKQEKKYPMCMEKIRLGLTHKQNKHVLRASSEMEAT